MTKLLLGLQGIVLFLCVSIFAILMGNRPDESKEREQKESMRRLADKVEQVSHSVDEIEKREKQILAKPLLCPAPVITQNTRQEEVVTRTTRREEVMIVPDPKVLHSAYILPHPPDNQGRTVVYESFVKLKVGTTYVIRFKEWSGTEFKTSEEPEIDVQWDSTK